MHRNRKCTAGAARARRRESERSGWLMTRKNKGLYYRFFRMLPITLFDLFSSLTILETAGKLKRFSIIDTSRENARWNAPKDRSRQHVDMYFFLHIPHFLYRFYCQVWSTNRMTWSVCWWKFFCTMCFIFYDRISQVLFESQRDRGACEEYRFHYRIELDFYKILNFLSGVKLRKLD